MARCAPFAANEILGINAVHNANRTQRQPPENLEAVCFGGGAKSNKKYINSILLKGRFKEPVQAMNSGSGRRKTQNWPKRAFSLPYISYNVHYTKYSYLKKRLLFCCTFRREPPDFAFLIPSIFLKFANQKRTPHLCPAQISGCADIF